MVMDGYAPSSFAGFIQANVFTTVPRYAVGPRKDEVKMGGCFYSCIVFDNEAREML